MGSCASATSASAVHQSTPASPSAIHQSTPGLQKSQACDENDGNEERLASTCNLADHDIPFLIWFRHSGQPEIESIPDFISDYQTMRNESDLLRVIGSYVITHARGSEDVLKILPTVAPNLTDFRFHQQTDDSDLLLKSLLRLKQLKVLHLPGNDFSGGLPDVVGELDSLTELKLYNCDLSELPDNLRQLKQLKILYLENNDFSKGFPSVVGELKSLTELILSRCSLTELSANLSQLKQLKVLHLCSNDFSKGLSSVVGELHSLTKLRLNNCQLRELPENLSELKQLEELDVSDNDFSKGLPSVVCELHSLTELNLSICLLNKLPETLSKLKQLKVLQLTGADFSGGLPRVVGKLLSLTDLKLFGCDLKELPDNLKNLQLRSLDLSWNEFDELPGIVYEFKGLERLQIKGCRQIKRIEDAIVQLVELQELECSQCIFLESPPYGVCQLGLSSILTYFTDLDIAKGVEAPTIPVAVIGKKLSGKTSIIRSLQSGCRELSYRNETSPLDETTKVFKLEELSLEKYRVRIIDHGGQEVYHMAYQLALKRQCIPLIVVSLEEFSIEASTSGYEEAARRVCFDWLSHFYLAVPFLKQPLLALTHIDKIPPAEFDECKNELFKNIKLLRENWLKAEKVYRERFPDNFIPVAHLSDDSQPVFHQEDVFEFDDNKAVSSNIVDLKKNIERYCQDFESVVPLSWEKVGTFIEQTSAKPYVAFSAIQNEFPENDCETILRYMHHAGKVLWFERNKNTCNDLSTFIFHQIPAITDMIALFLHHSADKQHEASMHAFSPFTHQGRDVGKEDYKTMLREFHEDGILDEALLHILVSEGSKFEAEVAEKLLRSFNIVHGPFQLSSTWSHRMVYTVPCFTKNSLDNAWMTDGPLQLRLEILFHGLPLPEYVFQQMTVAVLNRAKQFDTVNAASDGAVVEHEESTTYLVHDIKSGKVTLQLSTTVNVLAMSWTRLKVTAVDVINQISDMWKACHIESKMFCTHCLYLKDSNPGVTANPEWLKSNRTFDGLQLIACSKAKKRTVPKPIMLPCYNLSDAEVADLQSYLRNLNPVADS